MLVCREKSPSCVRCWVYRGDPMAHASRYGSDAGSSAAGTSGTAGESVPGSEDWCAAHGIDPDVWAERGSWRYDTVDSARVKEAFEPFLERTQLGTVTKAV